MTSNVFGLLSYLPPSKGIIPLLKYVQDSSGETTPFNNLPDDSSVAYSYWESLHEQRPDDGTRCESCEPDVLLRIEKPDGTKLNVLVEAKLWSGKSSLAGEEDAPPKDQLAKEWDNLLCLTSREQATPYLVFLTADLDLPAHAIQESKEDFTAKRPGQPFSCGWLSWRHVGHAFQNETEPHLADIVRVCKRLGLIFFSGMPAFAAPPQILWRFTANERTFNWDLDPVPKIEWRFSK